MHADTAVPNAKLLYVRDVEELCITRSDPRASQRWKGSAEISRHVSAHRRAPSYLAFVIAKPVTIASVLCAKRRP